MTTVHPKPKAKKRFEVKVPEPYKFIRTLGQGSFGSVHEVSKTPTGERFAMKILTFSTESDFAKNEHEIRKLSENQHRNVVGFVEAIEGDNAHFVVLELCSHSLSFEISEVAKVGGKMDVVRVYRVMRDVLDGLAFLHSRGEIYGDLKGSNVLIGSDGTAKLGDFGGVVGTQTLKTNNSAECGTMQFWAPELFSRTVGRDREIGSSAGDMWAFGQLLLEMLTSRWWIVGENAVEIQQSVLGFEIGSICVSVGIVGEVQTLLSLLLSKNPSHRISSAELVRTNRLQSVLGPETPLSRFVTQELESTRKQFEATRDELDEHKRTQELLLQHEQEKNNQLEMELKNEKEKNARLERELAESKSNQTKPPLQPAPHSSGVRSNGPLASSAARQGTVIRSQIGAAAIELFDRRQWTVYGNVFTKSETSQASLISFEFEAEVARLSLTIRKELRDTFGVGIISSYLSNKALTTYFPDLKGGAGWELYPNLRFAKQNEKVTNRRSACLGGRAGQRVVLEADGREGKRTLKLSQDGTTQPVFFTNIPVPFRFAVKIWNLYNAVEIESVSVVSSPQMVGGRIAVAMDE
ncbi:putative Mitogen-activated protein kinase kinase kinase 1 [Blattamonas nauphoetae]|uniref:Mitogen-activated protein kinase kinase kinase 1 n=1 Tax=Blattamonas nauphoetae TaxID=2049346 RepID=A0ABQ9WS02_9EUKA|nr:putative Mitogen-activated protein kinase kinase kinase 1 [Blattamonas nauphoetae]